MSTKHKIWAVILAAGESGRMKSPKLILPYGQSTIIGSLINNIRESELNDIIMVLGAWRVEMMEVARKLQVKYCINDNFKRGMLSSVITGLRAIPGDVDAAMIFPGDQPDIDPKTINLMISNFNKNAEGIFIAGFKGKRGHPILIPEKFFAAVEMLDEEKGLRELLTKFPDEVFEVEADNNLILRDIDTIEDYRNAINKSK